MSNKELFYLLVPIGITAPINDPLLGWVLHSILLFLIVDELRTDK